MREEISLPIVDTKKSENINLVTPKEVAPEAICRYYNIINLRQAVHKQAGK